MLMKKVGILVSLLALVILFVGCSSNTKNTTSENEFECESVSLSGTGEEITPFEINNVSEFLQISSCPTAAFKLMSDIDFNTEPINYEEGLYTYGIESVKVFYGVFDGNGHKISYQGDDVDPIFRALEGATVKNLILEWELNTTYSFIFKSVFGSHNADYGVLSNFIDESSLVENIYMKSYLDIDFPSTSDTYYHRAIGGLIGYNAGVVRNVSVDGDIDFNFTGSKNYHYYSSGGIIGLNFGLMENTAFEGEINMDASSNINKLYAGGIVGRNDGKLVKAYSEVKIYAESNYNSSGVDGVCELGGIVGYNSPSGIISDVMTYESDLHAFGGSISSAGGIVGVNMGSINYSVASGIIKVTSLAFSFEKIYGFGGIMGVGSSAKITNSIFLSQVDQTTSLFGESSYQETNYKLNPSILNNLVLSDVLIYDESPWIVRESGYPLLKMDKDFWRCEEKCELWLEVNDYE